MCRHGGPADEINRAEEGDYNLISGNSVETEKRPRMTRSIMKIKQHFPL